MISRRLRENEKIEILESYRGGMSTLELAKKYNCTSSTINRTVKTLLSEDEFSFLKDKRLKSNQNKVECSLDIKNINQDYHEANNKSSKSFVSPKTENNQDDFLDEVDKDFDNNQFVELEILNEVKSEDIDFDPHFEDQDNNRLKEVVPLVSDFGLEEEQQKVDCKTLDKESLPECVYMIVDKKVELEYQPISELPDWSFLPENELKRYAILLYPDQRSAKRNCSRNQKVIKIKNTNVFEITRSHLLSKGITRLILDNSLISLDD
tara:strand:- start:3496 stop:4290 length:795 start_codon:yes stop_codon:yes gene_type:complete